MNDFGIILRGKSLDKLPLICEHFNRCWIINSFENLHSEIKCLKGKTIGHYCNVLETTVMPEAFYVDFNIEEVVISRFTWTRDARQARKRYQKQGIKEFSLIPQDLSRYTKQFNRKHLKHPSTGVMSIIDAVERLKPKHVWICGLDFYEVDYLYRRDLAKPIEKQRFCMEHNEIPQQVFDFIEEHPKMFFHIASYYSKFPVLPNLESI